MKTALKLLGSVAALVAAAGVILVAGMRAKSPPVLNAVRRMSRMTKRFVLKSAGTSGSPTAVVRHVGRATGRAYETPVVAAATDGGYVVALPYGPNTDWLKNVRAAGRATIVVNGDAHEVETPEIITIEEATTHFRPKEQRLHRQFGVRQAVKLRSSRSGALGAGDDGL